MSRLRFEEMNLSEEMLRAVSAMGFEEASPIQSNAIPVLLSGKDIVGKSQTGTGKTAAFAIPVIEKIDPENSSVQAIVLCPTRELVIQVCEEFRKLMRFKPDIHVVPIYGGQEIDRQFKALKKNPQIIIGTPGRTIDHINRGTIKFDGVKFVVLDEADEMLDMGFRDDIELMLQKTPKSRQTILFSATMPEMINKIQKEYLKNPVRIDVSQQKMDSPKIDQYYFELRENSKPEALARLIDLHNIQLALVFCNTRNKVDELVEILKTRGYFAEGLHGDMNQKQREKIMYGFRNGTIEVLVATDVAGRGIDVNDIEAVFNYDLPGDDEDYIHRIGRTGRAGKTGIAFTFIVGKQIYGLRRIEREFELKLKKGQIPTITDMEENRLEKIREKLDKTISGGKLSKYINFVDNLMGEEYVALDIAAALLKMYFDEHKEGYDKSIVFEDHTFVETPKRDGKGKKSKKGPPASHYVAKRSEKRKDKRKEKDYIPFGYNDRKGKKHDKPNKRHK